MEKRRLAQGKELIRMIERYKAERDKQEAIYNSLPKECMLNLGERECAYQLMKDASIQMGRCAIILADIAIDAFTEIENRAVLLATNKRMELNLRDLGLPHRIWFKLGRVGITTLEECVMMGGDNIARVRHIGAKSLVILQTVAQEHGMTITRSNSYIGPDDTLRTEEVAEILNHARQSLAMEGDQCGM